MKKILTIAIALFVAVGGASAAKKKAPAKQSNKPVFTIVKEIPVTSMKDQNRSGTCWDCSCASPSAICPLSARSTPSTRKAGWR